MEHGMDGGLADKVFSRQASQEELDQQMAVFEA